MEGMDCVIPGIPLFSNSLEPTPGIKYLGRFSFFSFSLPYFGAPCLKGHSSYHLERNQVSLATRSNRLAIPKYVLAPGQYIQNSPYRAIYITVRLF